MKSSKIPQVLSVLLASAIIRLRAKGALAGTITEKDVMRICSKRERRGVPCDDT